MESMSVNVSTRKFNPLKVKLSPNPMIVTNSILPVGLLNFYYFIYSLFPDVAEARRSFLEGLAYQSGPVEKTATDLHDIQFKGMSLCSEIP